MRLLRERAPWNRVAAFAFGIASAGYALSAIRAGSPDLLRTGAPALLAVAAGVIAASLGARVAASVAGAATVCLGLVPLAGRLASTVAPGRFSTGREAAAFLAALCGAALISAVRRKPASHALAGSVAVVLAVAFSVAVLHFSNVEAVFRWAPLSEVPLGMAGALGSAAVACLFAGAGARGGQGAHAFWGPAAVGLAIILITVNLFQALRAQEKVLAGDSVQLASAQLATDLNAEISRLLGKLGKVRARLGADRQPARRDWETALELSSGGTSSLRWSDRQEPPAPKAGASNPIEASIPIGNAGTGGIRIVGTIEAGAWLSARLDQPAMSGLGAAILSPSGTLFERKVPGPAYEMAAEHAIEAQGLNLRVRVWPGQKWLSGHDSALDEVVLFSGLTTAALMFFVVRLAYTSRRRSKDLQSYVLELNRTVSRLNSAQQELQESESRFRTSVETVVDGFAMCSAIESGGEISDFTIEYVNDTACRMNEMPRTELEGGRLLSIRPKHPNPEFFEQYCEVVRAGKPFRRQCVEFIDDDEDKGIRAAYDIRAARLGDGFVSVWLDVTARFKAEESKRLTETRYRSLFERVPVGVYRSSVLGEILDANPALARILGYPSADALIGVNVDRIYIDLQDRREAAESLARTGVLFGAEFQMRRADGRVIWVRDTSRTVVAEGGAVVGYEGVIEDITEWRRAVEALRVSEDRYRQLIENANDLVYTTDLFGHVTSMNSAAERTFGCSRQNAVSVNFFDLVVPEMRAMAQDFVSAVLGGGGAGKTVELEIEDPYGRRVTLETSLRLYFSLGQPMTVQAIARDITERKNAERLLTQQREELARSNQELERFAYVASHDLQEPLRAVRIFAEMLAERYKGKLGAETDEFFGHIVSGGERMQRMIEDLLAYARVSTRGHALQPCGTGDALSMALENLRARLDQTNAHVTFDELPVVMADLRQLAQLFQNLLSNALKFHGEKPPRIHIGVRREDRDWIFEVTDNGIGIPEDQRERVFNIFERAHTDRSVPGTGIGLAIAKRIVQRHGGRIWVESEAGRGSTFFFTIPAEAEGEQHDADRQRDTSTAGRG